MSESEIKRSIVRHRAPILYNHGRLLLKNSLRFSKDLKINEIDRTRVRLLRLKITPRSKALSSMTKATVQMIFIDIINMYIQKKRLYS